MAKVLLETSARHIHLSQEHVDILFGAGHQLTHKKDLSQPGQFACEERVTVVGPKKEIKNVMLFRNAYKHLVCFRRIYYVVLWQTQWYAH